MSKKAFLKKPWVRAIGTLLILAGLAELSDLIFDTNISASLGALAKDILARDIPVRSLFIFLVIATIVSYLISYLLKIYNTGPFWLKYTTDMFFSIRWKWDYQKDKASGKYDIISLSAFCPKHDCSLIEWVCPICSRDYEKIGEFDNIKDRVKALIIRNSTNNIYPEDLNEEWEKKVGSIKK